MDNVALALRGARIGTAGKIKDVRADHVYRYRWAAERLSGHVIDAGCNCGYGAAILADAGLSVTALDVWAEGLEFARLTWDRPAIAWRQADFEEVLLDLPACDGVVAFEIVEHLERPEHLLRMTRAVSPRLLLSVPNEAVWPWQPRMAPVHHRHYTRGELGALLSSCGWTVAKWWGQKGPYAPVEASVNGTTLVVECC